jgi:hypothetical protein
MMDRLTMSAAMDESRATPVRRRNSSLALALVLLASSCTFIFGRDGQMVWLMWRDAPVVSFVLALAGVFFAVRWWRTPRS